MLLPVITMCFYGLSFNSGKQDLFKGTGLMAGVEVLAYFIILFTIDVGGRRPVLSVCQILAGLSCLCSGFVPEAYFWVRMTLALVGKMGASAAFAVVFVYTCELFHTPVRNSAMGEQQNLNDALRFYQTNDVSVILVNLTRAS